MRRNLLVAMSALGGVVVGARGVIAGTATGRTPVDCIDTVWRSSTVSTSSTTWQVVPGFEARTAIFPITVNVSALVSGAPARFRILSTNVGEQTVVSNPGVDALRTRGDRSGLVLVSVGRARRRRGPTRQPHPPAMAEPIG
jgi:hypothetical protein